MTVQVTITFSAVYGVSQATAICPSGMELALPAGRRRRNFPDFRRGWQTINKKSPSDHTGRSDGLFRVFKPRRVDSQRNIKARQGPLEAPSFSLPRLYLLTN